MDPMRVTASPTTSPCPRRPQHPLARPAAGAGEAPAPPKLYAALAYCRANGLNRIVIDRPPRLGASSPPARATLDVRQALDDLGIDEALAAEIGIRLYKVGMVWPLEAEACAASPRAGRDPGGRGETPAHRIPAQGRALQLARGRAPAGGGKFDEKGEWALLTTPAPTAQHRGPRRLAAARRRRASHDRG
jgi:indolepyruvate ferredoxin oxidoreductase